MGKLLVPHYKEYLAVSHDLLILETSECVQQFTDCDDQVMPGKDVRLGFPELIAVEDYLINILQGQQKSFELKGIARFNEPSSPFYIDLYITSYENGLIVLLEDSTERILLEQRLIHKNNKTNLLLKNLTADRNYVDKILMSIVDALFVTTQSGSIITVNQATIDLFEYSQEELIGQPISKIITDAHTFVIYSIKN